MKHIALVGGQPLPNLLPALHFKPQSILLVHSKTTQQPFSRLEHVLRQADMEVQSLCLDHAYQIPEIYAAIKTSVDQLGWSDPDIALNLTGGTKAMVLAASALAQQRGWQTYYLESENKQSKIYLYPTLDPTCWLPTASPIVLGNVLTLAHYLNVQLGAGNWRIEGALRKEGGPFERALAATLTQSGLFDEILAGVRFLGDTQNRREQGDIDLCVRKGNHIGVIEAKNKNEAKLDALKQLNYLSSLLGLYTAKFLAITALGHEDHKPVLAATGTTLIELTSFDKTASAPALSEADQQKLVTALCGRLG